MALIFGGEGDARGAELVREAVALVEGSDELAEDLRLLAWAAMGTLWLRESHADRTLIDRAIGVARQKSAVGVLPFLLSHVAVDGMASDRWTEAETAFNEAIDLARETGQRSDLGFALARLAWLEARQGKEALCRGHADEARALAVEAGLGLSEIWSIAALADLEFGLGRLDAAVELFEAEAEALRAREVGDVDLSPEPELVELHLRLGDRDRAVDHQASFEREAAAKGQPWALARAARGRGLLAPDDEIDRHFGEALAWHDQTPDVFEAARTRLLYGARLRRARLRLQAREHLRAALATFDHLGATPWSDITSAELAATGETARRRDPSTRNDLTPRELQIALLLASGSTTREAAAALFLSPKTIEFHLRSVYRKLDIDSRDELAASSTPDRVLVVTGFDRMRDLRSGERDGGVGAARGWAAAGTTGGRSRARRWSRSRAPRRGSWRWRRAPSSAPGPSATRSSAGSSSARTGRPSRSCAGRTGPWRWPARGSRAACSPGAAPGSGSRCRRCTAGGSTWS